MVVHGQSRGHEPVTLDARDGVEVVRLEDLGQPKDYRGGIEPVVKAYRTVADRASARENAEALLIPTRDADCFAACARVAQQTGARLIGWRHSPMAYERAIFDQYGWAMSALAGVSEWLCAQMRERSQALADRVVLVANGVCVPEMPPHHITSDTVRLIYTGRLDEPVKRVSGLIAMSQTLTTRGVPHELTIVGDGPAHQTMRERTKRNQSIRMVGAQSPVEVAALLRDHDVFVLGSRMEGLSLSALEAMAQGCAVVLSKTPSGAPDVVGKNEAGELVHVNASDDGVKVGAALADGVERVIERGTTAVGRMAHARAKRLFSIEAMGDAAERALRMAIASPSVCDGVVKAFHDERTPASVPADARERLRRVLDEVGPAGVVIHGLGSHTQALGDVILAYGGGVLAFADDDPGRTGEVVMGRPVVVPERAGETGAKIVVISSWLHEETIWERRAVYESQGLRVVRLYGTVDSAVAA